MSVLLAITSSMKFLSESSSLPPTAKSLRRTGSRSSTLVLVCLNTSRKYLGLGNDAICANAPAERSNPVTKVRNSIVLLVTNGLDGIQFSGLYGRINTEQESDEDGDSDAMTMEEVVTTVAQPAVEAIICDSANPNAIPIKPPAMEMSTASVRN